MIYKDLVNNTIPAKTGNNRTNRVDLVQGVDVKSSQAVFSRAGGYISLSQRETTEPFLNEIGVYSFDSYLNVGSFEMYEDIAKPASPEELLNSYRASYAVTSRLPNSEPIEPLDTVSLAHRSTMTRGVRGSAFFNSGRFEGVKIETSSRFSSAPDQILDSVNFFGNVIQEGYIKESINLQIFDDSITYDTDGILQKSDKKSRSKTEFIGGTGGSDRAEAGHFTLFYGGLYR